MSSQVVAAALVLAGLCGAAEAQIPTAGTVPRPILLLQSPDAKHPFDAYLEEVLLTEGYNGYAKRAPAEAGNMHDFALVPTADCGTLPHRGRRRLETSASTTRTETGKATQPPRSPGS